MRTLAGGERAAIAAAAGHWCFAYLEVTADDGATWKNLGALAVGGKTRNFVNTATISDSIDANTLTFSASLKRECDLDSLSPFRTDSLVNESVAMPGTYAPTLDLQRRWRVMIWVGARGTTPVLPDDYRELATGYTRSLVVNGLSDTIDVQGMGMEARILDAFVRRPRQYSGDMEDVIQQALDDQFGSGVITLSTPVSPSEIVDDTIGEINLMPALSDIAAIIGWTLRYRYDASDVHALTLFEPPRNATVPDWSIASTEYEDLNASIDISGVRNFVPVSFFNAATSTVETVVAPGAESGTVSSTAGVATFSTSQAGVLAAGAKIVIDRSADGSGDYVAYDVLTFDGTTGATLDGAPDFSGQQFWTSASITRYGLQILPFDLSADTKVNSTARASGLADAVLADKQDPALVQSLKATGLWFVDLHDFARTDANAVHYNEDQTGGVTSYTKTFADAMLEVTVNLAGKPKGRYTTWKRIGSGAGASALLPELLYVSAQFYDSGAYVGAAPFGQFIYSAEAGDRCFSIRIEHGTDPSFLTGTTVVDFGTLVLDGFTLTSSADRDKTYYFRFTPYSGGLVSGAVSGIPGEPEVRQVYVPPIPTDSSSVTFSRSVSGQLIATAVPDPTAIGVGAALGSVAFRVYFVRVPESSQWLALSTIPTAETEVGTEFRTQTYLVGAGAVRLFGNFKTVTGAPTVKLKYSSDAFGSVADLATWTPPGTGPRYSGFAALPSGAKIDAGLTLYVADGANTAALDIYELGAEFIPATVSGAREHSDEHAPEFS